MGSTSSQAPGLRRVMQGTAYFTLAFGSIVGVGWLVVMNDWLAKGGPLGAILAFGVGGLALIPVALVYGRLAEHMPEAGSEIAYTAAVFPPFVSFLTGWSMTFAYLVVCPFEAVAIGQLAGYAFPGLNAIPLYQVGGSTVFLPHLLLGIALTAAVVLVNVRGIRVSSHFQTWATFGLLAVFFVFAPLGWWHGRLARMEPLFAGEPGVAGALLSTLAVLAVVPYFLTGFETIPKCAEEAAEGFAPRRFGRLMLLALLAAAFFYAAVIAVVAMLYPWKDLDKQDFATAIAFRNAFGWEWLVRLMLLCATASLLKVFNGMFLASTRLLYAMGRRGLLAPALGTVHAHWRTPTVAIALVGGVTLLTAFLGRAVLEPITEVGSLAGALGWLAACLALTFGAGGKTMPGTRALGICGAVVSLALVAVAAGVFAWYHWLALVAWGALGLLLRKRA